MSGMKASRSFTRTLSGAGWADRIIADADAKARMLVSYITPAPEELIGAVEIRIVEYPDASRRSRAGTVSWEARHPIEAPARCVLRGFDRVDADRGEDGWYADWKRPFPRREPEQPRRAREKSRA
ncbi:hypothetical protein ACFRCG_46275 [Embleya sp. NPDC056575]|uniref:hypothetical protein n=1 Tax=unclassified Embleya TaxID=2699296 RepID=UPI0036BD74A8